MPLLRRDLRRGHTPVVLHCGIGPAFEQASDRGRLAVTGPYMVGGKQYIAVAAGGTTQLDYKRGNTVLVFALP